MKNITAFFFLSLFAFNFPGCPEESVKSISIKLDQFLIPILYHLNYEDYYSAKYNIDRLKRKWEINKVFVKASEEYKKEWGSLPEYLEKKINDLERGVIHQEKEKSLFIVNDIHCALSQWRVDQQVGYLPDEWYTFYFDVEILSNLANDQLLDLHDWEDLEWRHDYLTGTFFFISGENGKLGEFGIEEKEYDIQLAYINDALLLLLECMEEADRENVAAASELLEAHVLNTLALFGGVARKEVVAMR